MTMEIDLWISLLFKMFSQQPHAYAGIICGHFLIEVCYWETEKAGRLWQQRLMLHLSGD